MEFVASGPDTALAAVVFADGALKACTELLAALGKLCAEVNGDGPVRLRVLYVSHDRTESAMEEVVKTLPAACTAAVPFGADTSALRRLCGQSVAMALPTLVMLDARTGAALGTDGRAALRSGVYAADKFPAWGTNCFTVRWDGRVSGSAGSLHPEGALRAGLYPGDAVVLQPVGGTTPASTSCVYANPPEDSEAGTPVVPAGETEILLPESVLASMQIEEGRVVAVSAHHDLPEAEEVVLRALPTSVSSRFTPEVSLSRVIQPWFGLAGASADTAHVAAALTELRALYEDDDAVPLHLMRTVTVQHLSEGITASEELLLLGIDSWEAFTAAVSAKLSLASVSGVANAATGAAVSSLDAIASGDVLMVSGNVVSGADVTVPPTAEWVSQFIGTGDCVFRPVYKGLLVVVPTGAAAAAASAGGSGGTALPGLAASGYSDGCGYAAYTVETTVPRGTVVVGPGTSLTIAP